MRRCLKIVFVVLFLLCTTGCQEMLTWSGAYIYQAQTKSPNLKTAGQLVQEGLCAGPRIRVGYLPSPTLGTVFSGPEELGKHGYRPNLSERNGLVYTCKAGHIDIGHARKAADWTVFLAAKAYQNIINNKTGFSFKLYEPSRYFVRITYPDNWKDLTQEDREHLAFEVSVELGRYFAFTGVTWHEIITWFGFKSKGFEPEHPSAFTWEESFSNLFGTYIAALALRDTQHTYNEAITLAFEGELRKLNAMPGRVSRRAAESVRGRWFTGDFFYIVMKKRNFDIGLDDGFITPVLIPSVPGCEKAVAQPYSVPDLRFVREYGFSVKFEIEPKIWEENEILEVAYIDRPRQKKRIEPAIHFAPLMDYIREAAIRKYGPDVDLSSQ